MLLGILTLYFQHYTQFQAYSLRYRRPDADADSRRHAMVGLLGLLRRLRREGADVPVPHLAARRAHRSAHGRLRDPGQRSAEDGDVRLPALLAAAAAGLRQESDHHQRDGDSLHHRHRLRRAGLPDAEGLEEAGGVFVGEPPGLLHAGNFRAESRRASPARSCSRSTTASRPACSS